MKQIVSQGVSDLSAQVPRCVLGVEIRIVLLEFVACALIQWTGVRVHKAVGDPISAGGSHYDRSV